MGCLLLRFRQGEGQWVPDISVSACMLCRADFSFWIRRHHCRRCGAVVCDSCSLNRTKFIYKVCFASMEKLIVVDLYWLARRVSEQEITPSKTAEEDCRVCDLCIQVIDEKLAEGLNKRFGKSAGIPVEANENDDSSNKAAPLPASKSASRTVLTVGRYRCVPPCMAPPRWRWF